MDSVISFLQAQKPTAYSTTTLAHKFGLKRGYIKYMLEQHEDVRSVLPVEVGSGKTCVNVYKAK